jgi:hypothetical protein
VKRRTVLAVCQQQKVGLFIPSKSLPFPKQKTLHLKWGEKEPQKLVIVTIHYWLEGLTRQDSEQGALLELKARYNTLSGMVCIRV